MSRYYSAAQYEQDFLPHRLGNWQVNPHLESKFGTAENRYSTLLQPPARTGAHAAPMQFLVDDRGHLKPGVKRINNSFRIKLTSAESAPARWPKPSPSIRSAPCATMGYKCSKPSCETGRPVYDGVVTTRLPRRGQAVRAQPDQLATIPATA